MEAYPADASGSLWLASSSDLTAVLTRSGVIAAWLLWVSSGEALVLPSSVASISAGGFTLDFTVWGRVLPPMPWRTMGCIEELVAELRGELSFLAGRRVLVELSGGKDSTAALIVAKRLSELLNFQLEAVYSHMPVLEPEENIDFVEEVASRLDVKLHVVKPDEWVLWKYLREQGLPYRGARWCTYLKVRPIRRLERRGGYHYTIVGDRSWEAIKRLRRLRASKLRDGRTVYPLAALTLLDVAALVREYGLAHPDYARGLPRVSCSYCPYKSLWEVERTRPTGYEAEVEEVMRREWRRWYEPRGIGWEEFREQHLWRLTPTAARAWVEARRSLLRSNLELPRVGASVVAEAYSSVWRNELPWTAPCLEREEAVARASALLSRLALKLLDDKRTGW